MTKQDLMEEAEAEAEARWRNSGTQLWQIIRQLVFAAGLAFMAYGSGFLFRQYNDNAIYLSLGGFLMGLVIPIGRRGVR